MTHDDVTVSRRVLHDWVSQYDNPAFYQWAIVPADTGEPIGSIGVVQENREVASVHIGYCIGRKWWHQGYTSEALRALLCFFFEQVGVNRVDSRNDPNNPHSGMVMAHCGMERNNV